MATEAVRGLALDSSSVPDEAMMDMILDPDLDEENVPTEEANKRSFPPTPEASPLPDLNGLVDQAENRRSVPVTTPAEIYAALNNCTKFKKRTNVETAEISLETKKIQLLTHNTSISKNYGYTYHGSKFLFPEEALYFNEIQKVEVLVGSVPISVQRARVLLLDGLVDADIELYNGTKCGLNEYVVYKHLAREGYRLLRPKHLVDQVVKSMNGVSTINGAAETSFTDSIILNGSGSAITVEDTSADDDIIYLSDGTNDNSIDVDFEPEPAAATSPHRKKRDLDTENDSGEAKRRRVKEAVEQRETSSSPDIICDYESPTVGNAGAKVSFEDCERAGDDSDDEIMFDADPDEEGIIELGDTSSSLSSVEDLSEPVPSTSRGAPAPYTVTEEDSDVEFIDEVNPGVEIQELNDPDKNFLNACSSGEDESIEAVCVPQVASSFGDQDFVDLASSDDDELISSDLYTTEPSLSLSQPQQGIANFADTVWPKLVPNTTALFRRPPGNLLPENITETDNVYSFSGTPRPGEEEMLEDIVESLNLSEESEKDSAKFVAKDWKDWRDHIHKTTTNVFKSSILGSAVCADGKSMENSTPRSFAWNSLHLWPKDDHVGPDSAEIDIKFLSHYRFDAFSPTEKTKGKGNANVSGSKPTFKLLIAKSNSPIVRNLQSLAKNGKDCPVVVGVVDEDLTVTFITLGAIGAASLI